MRAVKSDHKAEVRTQILQAALQILEAEGVQQLTVRKIAALAKVNVAAVNYYFGSKDQVVFEALQSMRERFGQAFLRLQANELPPRERLLQFLNDYCDAAFDYPHLVQAFINQTLNADIQEDYAQFVRQEGLLLITKTLAEMMPGDEETLRMRAFQLMSSLVLILLVGRDTQRVIGLDFNQPEVRQRYFALIVPA